MANQYTLTNDFAAIAEEKGTIYNKGDSAIELASTADTEKGAGILLLTGERRTFSGTLYARSMDAAGLLNVADFKDGGEGGEDNLSGVPLGTILPYSGTGDTPPYGFLFFEGQAVSRTMYAAYFDLVGTTYGEGDGKNTFNLPNLIDAAMLHGSYTKTSYETAGSATFTAPKTGFYKITVKGGGGGGDGGAYGAAVASGYLGGGEGGTTIAYEKMTAGQTASVVIGAGGAGGTGNPNSLNNRSGYPGGNSTVTVNGITYSGGGGISSVGGTGTIPGASGSNGYATTITSISATGGSGGGSGGGVHDQNGILGGGGGAGSAQIGSYANNGGKGGDGYVWIEYIGVSMRYIGKVYDAPTPSSAQVDLSQYLSDLARRLTREQTPAFNKRDVITTSGTYTAPVTGWYRITVKGGGGGGQGGSYFSTYGLSGNGGGEGGTTIAWEKMTAGQTASVVVGAGGTGGAKGANASGAYGTAGGNSSVTVNSNTYTGGGGQGGGNNSFGGTGTVGGLPGGPVSIVSVSGPVVQGGRGGGRLASYSGSGGNGGNARYNDSTYTTNGLSGYSGFAAFEYFDPSLM